MKFYESTLRESLNRWPQGESRLVGATEILPLFDEGGCGSWAALTRTPQILEGDKNSVDTVNLILVAVSGGEGDWRDARVVHDTTAIIHVPVQGVKDFIFRRWTEAGNLDGIPVGTFDSTIAVTGSGWVQAAGVASLGDEVRVDTALGDGSREC